MHSGVVGGWGYPQLVLEEFVSVKKNQNNFKIRVKPILQIIFAKNEYLSIPFW